MFQAESGRSMRGGGFAGLFPGGSGARRSSDGGGRTTHSSPGQKGRWVLEEAESQGSPMAAAELLSTDKAEGAGPVGRSGTLRSAFFFVALDVCRRGGLHSVRASFALYARPMHPV
jgi:hypothetical protein